MLKYALPLAAAVLLGPATAEAGVASAAKSQATAADVAALVQNAHYKWKKSYRKHVYKKKKKHRYQARRYHRQYPPIHYVGPPFAFWDDGYGYYWGHPVRVHRRGVLYRFWGDDCDGYGHRWHRHHRHHRFHRCW
jgi:hypothetical protein